MAYMIEGVTQTTFFIRKATFHFSNKGARLHFICKATFPFVCKASFHPQGYIESTVCNEYKFLGEPHHKS